MKTGARRASLNLSNFRTGCGNRTSHSMFPHSTMPPSPGLKHTSANLAALLSLGAALAEMCAGVNVKTTEPEEQSTNLLDSRGPRPRP